MRVWVMRVRARRTISTRGRWLSVLATTHLVLVGVIPARGPQAERRSRGAEGRVVGRQSGYALGVWRGGVGRAWDGTELRGVVGSIEGWRGRAIRDRIEKLVDGGSLVVLLMQAVHPAKYLENTRRWVGRTASTLERSVERPASTNKEDEENEAATALASFSFSLLVRSESPLSRDQRQSAGASSRPREGKACSAGPPATTRRGSPDSDSATRGSRRRLLGARLAAAAATTGHWI